MNGSEEKQFAIVVKFGEGLAFSRTLVYRFETEEVAKIACDILNDMAGPKYAHEVTEVNDGHHKTH